MHEVISKNWAYFPRYSKVSLRAIGMLTPDNFVFIHVSSNWENKKNDAENCRHVIED